MERTYILSYAQLLLLLSQRQISGLQIFEEFSLFDPDAAELKKAMLELIREGHLVPGEDDRYMQSPYIHDFMAVLEGTARSVVLRPLHGRGDESCLYFLNSRGAALQTDPHHKEQIRVSCGEIRSLAEDVLSLMELDDTSTDSGKEIEDTIDVTASAEELEKSMALCLLAEIYPRGSRERSRLVCVAEGDHGSVIIAAEGGDKKRDPYSMQKLIDRILEG